jgi:osmotically-inducible protein OsmY
MGEADLPIGGTMNRTLSRMLAFGAAFMTTAVVAGASITVTEQRLIDQRIQSDVMGVLASDPELSGRVVVETADQVVTMSGFLSTQGQIRRAGRDASQVKGVRSVVNEIRTRVGVVSNN